MVSFIPGQRARLADLTASARLEIRINSSGRVPVCLGLARDGRLLGSEYLLAGDGRPSPLGTVKTEAPSHKQFAVDLATLPDAVERLVFLLVDEGLRGDGTCQLALSAAGAPVLTFTPDAGPAHATLLLLELYRKDGWRVAASGQVLAPGWAGLLAYAGRPDLLETLRGPAAPHALERGERFRLQTLAPGAALRFRLEWEPRTREVFDVLCVGLDAQGRPCGADQVLHGGHKQNKNGSLRAVGSLGGHSACFDVDLATLPADTMRVAFVLVAEPPANLAQLARGVCGIGQQGHDMLRLDFDGSLLATGAAALLVELYHKDGGWRVCAPSEALSGGLAGWFAQAGRPDLLPKGASAPAPRFRALARADESVTLDLREGDSGRPLEARLAWESTASVRRGLFGLVPGRSTVELGCLYLLETGHKGVSPALGHSFYADRPPFLTFDAADAWALLAAHRPQLLSYGLLFARVTAGARDFSELALELTVQDPLGGEVALAFSPSEPGKRFVALATLERVADELVLTRTGIWLADLAEADRKLGLEEVRFSPR